MASDDYFSYSRLPSPTSFRTLKLYPEDPQTLGDILRGSLQIHNEEPQKVPYETLSYVWGNPKLTHKIQLSDDKALPITANLHAALTSLAAQNWP